MTLKTGNPPLGAAGSLNIKAAVAAVDSQVSIKSRVRLQRLAKRIHALGPKPLFHLLQDLERGADLHNLLEAYAGLPADLIEAYKGDQFQPPVLIKEGGR